MTERFATSAHASFRLDVCFPIEWATDGDLLELWQIVSYRILRKPNDLLSHTRRIRLCREPALQDCLAGALLDLGYVLNGQGTALWSRLHTESLPVLGDDKQLLLAPLTQNIKGQLLPSLSHLMRSEYSGGAAEVS